MDFLHAAADIFLHLDRHLGAVIESYGRWTYGLLAAIIFLETGVVATPFLPGDSLLFAAGAFAGLGSLDPIVLWLLLASAAIAGDTTNYWIGRAIGPRIFSRDVWWAKREYLLRTESFYERHGGKTIILARFAPIVRTFAPFVAGIGRMPYRRFLAFSVVGGFTWVGLFVGAGYFFGNLAVVRDNFSLVILAIIVISLMPLVIEGLRARRERAGGAPWTGTTSR
jgi:membrane-associated protein